MKKCFLLMTMLVLIVSGIFAQVNVDRLWEDTVEETQPVNNAEEKDVPVMFAEERPEFPGGLEALNNFLTSELQYPDEARNNGVTGTVLVNFVIGKDGQVRDAKVRVPLSPECDEEAIRVVMSMPRWKAGKNMGKEVSCYFTLPVSFR